MNRTYDPRHLESTDHLLLWITQAPGAFSVWDLAPTFEERELLTWKLEAMVRAGVLNRWGEKRGWYIKRDSELDEIDLFGDEANMGPVDIWLPLESSDLVEIYPGNIIIFAGAKDAGKTGLSLNTAWENRHRWDVHYFNSEMGAAELKKRLDLSEYTLDMWTDGITFYRRAINFSDVVKQGSGCLNIIDFLEIHDEFYAIGRALKEIHDRLDGAVAIVNMQKKHPGLDVPPLGSWRALEVCRLCLSIDYNQCKIKIAKNWRDPKNNPKNKAKSFQLVGGFKIIDRHGWYNHDENANQEDT